MTEVKLADHGTVVYRLSDGKRVGAVYRRVDQTWYGQRHDEKPPRLHSWPSKGEAVAWLEADTVGRCRLCIPRSVQ